MHPDAGFPPSPLAGEGGCHQGLLGFAKGPYLLILLQLAWLSWLLAFPVALDSDDALNFAHGVVRFSVLEFAPPTSLATPPLSGWRA